MIVNGKEYPMWGQFVEDKKNWIGRKLIAKDLGVVSETIVTDIELRENGKNSAYFEIIGEKFSCGFDVQYGDIVSSEGDEGVTFSGMYIGSFKMV